MFMKFALHSLHFTKPASPCDSQCSLLHTCSLKDRRANAGLLFLNDLLVGNIIKLIFNTRLKVIICSQIRT